MSETKLPARVRVVSDGIGVGTQVFDERGDPISKYMGIGAIEWSIRGGNIAHASIEFAMMSADVDGVAHYFVVIGGERKEIASVCFADGTQWTAPAG